MGPPPTEGQRAGAAAAGVSLTEIPVRLEWMDDPWDDVDRAAGRLLELEEEVRPDVVHLNGFCHAALPWRAPVVVAAHSCVCSWWRAVHADEIPARLAEYRTRVARGLHAASAIVCPSAAMRRALQTEYGVTGGRVVPNGSAFAPTESVPRERIVFSAGRLWDEAKNLDALCAVASRLPWPVFVAGDNRHPQGRPASHAGVRYLGQLAPDTIREWYARASIYALPARYEPFGLSVLEAARSGCALVLGDIRSLRENWDGAAAFVAPDNRRALAAALAELIEDDGRRERLAAAAAARAARFTVERMAAGYLETYADVPAVAA
jgi:glycosyltransferase involved in cell wall biosynthesis